MRSHLQERFAAEREAYNALKESTESLVVSWRYSQGQLWSYNPIVWDTLTEEEVADPGQAEYAYGYDAEGRVVCIRQFTIEHAGKLAPSGRVEIVRTQRVYNEHFILHRPGLMEISEYATLREPAGAKELTSVYEVRTENGRIVEKAELRKDSFDHDRYFWEGERLKVAQSLDESGKTTCETEWEADGTSKIYQIRKDGSRFWRDEPLPKGVTVKSLAGIVRQRLLELIPQTVKAAGLEEPAYCVALAYDGEGNDVLGPHLGIGLDSERQKWLKEHGEEAWQFIWNPAEFANYEKSHTQLEADDLYQASEWLNRALADRGSLAPAIKLLVEVAAELEKLDWSRLIQTTPDFVVYAVDFELADLRKNLKQIVRPGKLAALKRAKLI